MGEFDDDSLSLLMNFSAGSVHYHIFHSRVARPTEMAIKLKRYTTQ